MLSIRRYIFLFLLLQAPLPLLAQFFWENSDLYTTRSGLPNNSIISLYQDSKGYLWIGTYNGLCRYDGHEFKVYRDELSSRSGWVFSVSTISEDTAGNILIGTKGGIVAKLNRKSDTWKYLSVTSTDITGTVTDNDGKEWVTTRDGFIGKIQNDSMIRLKHFGQQLRGLSYYSKDEFLLESDITYLYNIKTNRAEDIMARLPIPHLIEAVYTSQTHTYFVHTGNKVTVKKAGSEAIHTFTLPEELDFNQLRDPVAAIRNGNLVIITPNGLYEISERGKIVGRLQIDRHSRELNRNFVNKIYEDNTGLIWIGTNAGLFKIDKKKLAFKKIASSSTYMPIKHNYVRSLLSQNNELWIGARFGEVVKLTLDTLTGKALSQEWFGALTARGKIDRNYTTNALAVDHQGNIWAGGNYLFMLKKGEEFFKPVSYRSKSSSILLPDIWSLFFIADDKLLIGTVRKGLFLLDTENNILERCGGQAEEISAWNIYQSSDGRIWVGTGSGLYLYEKSSNELKLFVIEGSSALLKEDIWSINEDRFANMWFGTTSDGIFCLEKSTARFKHYNESAGLSDNVTSGVVPDAEGNIWVSTINGLSKFDIKQQKFFNFNEEDGLISNDFNFKSYTRTPGGEIYFGTKVGIVAFNPEEIESSGKTNAHVQITSFRVQGSEHFIDNKIELDHNSNNLSFKFALPDFRKPLTHTYRYKLIGFDEDWQYTSAANPSATYTNLSPNKYKFIVQASVDDKNWSPRKATMSIYIEPALWQRRGTWVGTGFIMLFASVVVVRRRIRFLVNREREKAKVQKAMAELEMKALRAQMNPHFIFNAVTAIQHYVVKNDILQANEYLSKFARLMRSFLELSRFKYVSLAKEIELLQLYIALEKLRFDERFDYIVEIDEKIFSERIMIPSMLLQPFVENAINHGLVHKGEKGLLKLIFRLNDEEKKLYCIIDDNGVGRQYKGSKKNNVTPHMSLGTKIVEERVKSFLDSDDLKITVKVKDKYAGQGVADGTLVEVGIPLTQQTVLPDEDPDN